MSDTEEKKDYSALSMQELKDKINGGSKESEEALQEVLHRLWNNGVSKEDEKLLPDSLKGNRIELVEDYDGEFKMRISGELNNRLDFPQEVTVQDFRLDNLPEELKGMESILTAEIDVSDGINMDERNRILRKIKELIQQKSSEKAEDVRKQIKNTVLTVEDINLLQDHNIDDKMMLVAMKSDENLKTVKENISQYSTGEHDASYWEDPLQSDRTNAAGQLEDAAVKEIMVKKIKTAYDFALFDVSRKASNEKGDAIYTVGASDYLRKIMENGADNPVAKDFVKSLEKAGIKLEGENDSEKISNYITTRAEQLGIDANAVLSLNTVAVKLENGYPGKASIDDFASRKLQYDEAVSEFVSASDYDFGNYEKVRALRDEGKKYTYAELFLAAKDAKLAEEMASKTPEEFRAAHPRECAVAERQWSNPVVRETFVTSMGENMEFPDLYLREAQVEQAVYDSRKRSNEQIAVYDLIGSNFTTGSIEEAAIDSVDAAANDAAEKRLTSMNDLNEARRNYYAMANAGASAAAEDSGAADPKENPVKEEETPEKVAVSAKYDRDSIVDSLDKIGKNPNGYVSNYNALEKAREGMEEAAARKDNKDTILSAMYFNAVSNGDKETAQAVLEAYKDEAKYEEIKESENYKSVAEAVEKDKTMPSDTDKNKMLQSIYATERLLERTDGINALAAEPNGYKNLQEKIKESGRDFSDAGMFVLLTDKKFRSDFMENPKDARIDDKKLKLAKELIRTPEGKALYDEIIEKFESGKTAEISDLWGKKSADIWDITKKTTEIVEPDGKYGPPPHISSDGQEAEDPDLDPYKKRKHGPIHLQAFHLNLDETDAGTVILSLLTKAIPDYVSGQLWFVHDMLKSRREQDGTDAQDWLFKDNARMDAFTEALGAGNLEKARKISDLMEYPASVIIGSGLLNRTEQGATKQRIDEIGRNVRAMQVIKYKVEEEYKKDHPNATPEELKIALESNPAYNDYTLLEERTIEACKELKAAAGNRKDPRGDVKLYSPSRRSRDDSRPYDGSLPSYVKANLVAESTLEDRNTLRKLGISEGRRDSIWRRGLINTALAYRQRTWDESSLRGTPVQSMEEHIIQNRLHGRGNGA